MDLALIFVALLTLAVLIVLISRLYDHAADRWKLYRIRRRAQHKEDAQSQGCALCGKPKGLVEGLVAGESGAVCFGCMRSAIRELDRQPESVPRHALTVLLDLLAGYPQGLPVEFRERLLAVLETPVTDEGFQEALLQALVSARLASSVVAILVRLPAERWTDADLINWMWAHYELGEYQSALTCPVREPVATSERRKRHLEVARVAVLVELAVTTEEYEELLERIEKLKRQVLSEEYPLQPDSHIFTQSLDESEVRCLLMLDRPEEAERRLIDLEGRGAQDAETFLLRGDIAERRRDSKAAGGYWRQALECRPSVGIRKAVEGRFARCGEPRSS